MSYVLKDYQKDAMQTAGRNTLSLVLENFFAMRERWAHTEQEIREAASVNPDDALNRVVFALGLSGESAELAEVWFSDNLPKVKKELGDVLWYIAACADSIGLFMTDLGGVPVQDDPNCSAATRLMMTAGLYADVIKKHFGHGHNLNTEKARNALSNVFQAWQFFTRLAGHDPDDVAKANVMKLAERYKGGKFTVAESHHKG